MTTYYHAQVGEHDPAYVAPTMSLHFCSRPVLRSGEYFCTLLQGHVGPHVGHAGGIICAIQDNWIPEELRVSEGL